MTPFKRPVSAAGVAVLLALSLSACGSSYPEDASKDDFCNALKDVGTTSTEVEGEEPTEDEWENIQQSYEDLGETGTPEDIGEDERKGFEVIVKAITDLDYDDAKEEFGDRGGEDIPGVSEEDNDNAEKFFAYATTECADALGGGGSDDGSGETTEEPTDEATEEPTEEPTDDGLTSESPAESPTAPESTETE